MATSDPDVSGLAYERRGSGAPLVLLHGIGERWQVWEPVLDRLAAERDVLAVDFPGFGASAPLPPGEVPTPARLLASVRALADSLGLERPWVSGISMGGMVALEAAASGWARGAVAISPAGLWGPGGPSAYTRGVLRALRGAGTALAPRADALLRTPVARAALGGLNYGRAWRVPAAVMADDLRALAHAPGWDATRDALQASRFTGGAALAGVPVTVAWGTRDAILPWPQVQRDLLPPSTNWVRLPGCGHTPTWDDPERVADVVLRGTSAA